MSNWAVPGAQCVCIKDEFGHVEFMGYIVPVRVPMMGEILTVSAVIADERGVFLSFEEIPVRQCDGPLSAEARYAVECFRPLTKRKTDISIFKRMLTPAPKDVVPA
ncbi:hypothetical protein ACFHWW_27265 [Ensifer sp. P24N7]|uniref:hypothetical protein n=1 Tax=Sinorhizobium sp. P24N7 TaxID=3348358 RepID=UPI0035F31CC5